MHPLEYPHSEQVDYTMGAQLYQEDVDILPQPGPRTTRRRRRREGVRGGFQKEEDEVLCSTFLNVGKDAITGVNQTLERARAAVHGATVLCLMRGKEDDRWREGQYTFAAGDKAICIACHSLYTTDKLFFASPKKSSLVGVGFRIVIRNLLAISNTCSNRNPF